MTDIEHLESAIKELNGILEYDSREFFFRLSYGPKHAWIIQQKTLKEIVESLDQVKLSMMIVARKEG